MKKTSLRLCIAGTIVELRSRYPLKLYESRQEREEESDRFKGFLDTGKRPPQIIVDVDIKTSLPALKGALVFTTFHPADHIKNWALLRSGSAYVYRSFIEGKLMVATISKDFSRVNAIFLPKPEGFVWEAADVIYDFLQVVLINYLAKKKEGFLLHACGVRDVDDRGFVFAGRSGRGKSTMAKIWHQHTRAIVLNDDRLIVRRMKNGGFVVHGSPWHGEFFDYIDAGDQRMRPAYLFFLSHASKHAYRPMTAEMAFTELYTTVFPPFWDHQLLSVTADLCREFAASVKPLHLGFAKNESIIHFVRSLHA
jgi:hypothetical protein